MDIGTDGTNRLGVHLAGAAFENLGLAFRDQPTSDFGIDAHFEPRANARGTGDLVALQIKSGGSYFRESTPEGWWVRIETEHANYWLRHSLTVALILVDVSNRLVFWEAVTNRTVCFTENGAKIHVPRTQLVAESNLSALRDLVLLSRDLGRPAAEGAGCRVFLGRGVAGREGWEEFSRILLRQLVEEECLSGWDVVVKVRTGAENEDLEDTNEYGADGDDLVSIETDMERQLITYSVSAREADHMCVSWNIDHRAEIAADGILQYLIAEVGLLDEDDEDEGALREG